MRLQIAEFTRQDNRGSLVQLATGNWEQVNVLFINKGEAFGGHYHKEKEELFIVMRGEVRVTIKTAYTRDYFFHAGESFIIEAGNHHTIQAWEDSQLVELITKKYDPKDTYA